MLSVDQLRRLDIAKQAAYLLGMAAAWAIYSALASGANMKDRTEQVVALHWVLVAIELLVLVALWRAFDRQLLRSCKPLMTT